MLHRHAAIEAYIETKKNNPLYINLVPRACDPLGRGTKGSELLGNLSEHAPDKPS